MLVDYPDYTIDLEDEPYQFYIAGVWVKDDGLYLSTDSGCSCPSPWESHTNDVLTGPLTWDQVKEELTSLAKASYYGDYASANVESFIESYEATH